MHVLLHLLKKKLAFESCVARLFDTNKAVKVKQIQLVTISPIIQHTYSQYRYVTYVLCEFHICFKESNIYIIQIYIYIHSLFFSMHALYYICIIVHVPLVQSNIPKHQHISSLIIIFPIRLYPGWPAGKFKITNCSFTSQQHANEMIKI